MSNELHKHVKNRQYSQFGEDGIIDHILSVLGIDNSWFVEAGAGNGKNLSNTRFLVERGWSGLLVEYNNKLFRELRKNTRGYPSVYIHNCKLSCEDGSHIDDIMDIYNIPDDFDVLSLDIDGNDYWVFESIQRKPKIVVIEYNMDYEKNHGLELSSKSIEYDPDFVFMNTDYHGATPLALYRLAQHKGYKFIGYVGVNLIFISEVLGDNFEDADIRDVPIRKKRRIDGRMMIDV